jgi:hypothetical protein
MNFTTLEMLSKNAKRLIQYAIDHFEPETSEDEKDDNVVLYSPSFRPLLEKVHQSIEPFPPGKSFSDLIWELRDQNNDFNDASFYTRVNIDKGTWSKIISNRTYQPSIETVFKCIIGFCLSINQATILLESAGFSFHRSRPFDLVLYSAVMLKIFDPIPIDEALEFHAKKTLFSSK